MGPAEENPDHMFGHNELGFPKSVKLVYCKRPAKMWSFFYELEVPIHQCTRRGKSIFDPQDHCNDVRAYDHLCRTCLEELRVKEKRHPAEWGTALCKIINTSNGHAHLSRLHKHNEEVETHFSLKDNAAPRKSPSRASDDPHSPIKSTGVLSLAAKRNLQEQSRRLQAEWLNYNGIPHNVTRNPEFKKMFQICTNTFVPISPPT